MEVDSSVNTKLQYQDFVITPSGSDCIIIDYKISGSNAGITTASGLEDTIFGSLEVIPSDITVIASYVFYIYAKAKGQSQYSLPPYRKTLIVGCPNTGDIIITDNAARF